MTTTIPSQTNTNTQPPHPSANPISPTETQPISGAPPSNEASSSESKSTQPPKSVSELPPAALELAASLFDAARAGNTNTLLQYIRAGIPPNLTNSSGDTLLMLAAYHGHADTVKSLLEVGADANVLNERGQCPLAAAVFKGFDQVVKVLFEKAKADIHLGHPTAVDCAVMFKQERLLKMFGVEVGEGTVNGGMGMPVP
jgi:ankyrin repeat protein